MRRPAVLVPQPGQRGVGPAGGRAAWCSWRPHHRVRPEVDDRASSPTASWPASCTGPTLSPLGQLVTRVITPRLGRGAPGGGATQALRAGHGRGLLAVGADPERARLLDRGAGDARPARGGGEPRSRRFAVCLGCMTFGVAHAGGRGARRSVRALQRHLVRAAGRGRLSAPLSCRRRGRRGCSCRRACPDSPG